MSTMGSGYDVSEECFPNKDTLPMSYAIYSDNQKLTPEDTHSILAQAVVSAVKPARPT